MMSDEIELPTCHTWNCDTRIYFLEEHCPGCGARQDWYQFLQVTCPNCNQPISSDQWSCYCGHQLNVWIAVIQEALAHPAHTDLAVAKGAVPHPTDREFKRGEGKPVGQQANYRVALPDERGIHVKGYKDHYKVHWDRVAPSQNGLGHLLSDAPVETALVTGLGYLLFKSEGS